MPIKEWKKLTCETFQKELEGHCDWKAGWVERKLKVQFSVEPS